MKVIKINSSFIRPHTIKSFSVYAEQEFIVLKIFIRKNHRNYRFES
ncbi:hypothetical protein ACV3CL_000657 [Campylobacter jejuni]